MKNVLAVAALLVFSGLASASSTGGSADVTVTCTATGTEVSQLSVTPQRDGVHLAVVNRTGREMMFDGGGRGFEVPVEGASAVLDLPPGSQTVTCIDPTDPAQDGPSSPGFLARRATFVVADVSFWKPYMPECGPGGLRVVTADGAFPPIPRSQLLLQAMLSVRGLRASDIVERAGYPAGPTVHIRTVRDGRVISVAHFGQSGSGFYSNGVWQCIDTLATRLVSSTRSSPKGAASALLDGEALTVLRDSAMRPGLRRRLGQPFRVRCELNRRVLVGSGRFLPGASAALVFLTERPSSGRPTRECLVYSGASRLVALRGFRPL
jgi:hypothetical protein